MNFFKAIGKVATGVVKTAAPVVLTMVQPEALVNVALGSVGKHAIAKLPNNAIPYLNLAISSGVSYAKNVGELGWEGALMPALQEGGALAGLSTAIHQSLKLPTKGTLKLRGQSL